MSIEGFPYVATGASAEEDGQALAAAGVLQAAGFRTGTGRSDLRELRAQLRSLLAKTPDATLTWRQPEGGHGELGTDVALAEAWRDAFAESKTQGPARLLIKADALVDPAALPGLLRRLQAPLLAYRGHSPDLQDLGAGVIAGMSLLTGRAKARHPRRHDWSWPLRINLPPSVVGAGVERGFIEDKPFGTLDVALAEILPDRGPERNGVRLIIDPALDPAQALQRRLSGRTFGGRPEALAPVNQAALSELLTALSYEVAHNAPIDFALTLAWLRHGVGDLAPIFLASDRDWAAELEASRLQRRIEKLVSYLRRLPRSEILYVEGPLRAFGLEKDIGATGPRELANRLEEALRSRVVRYDRESDVATDLLTLGRAIPLLPAQRPEYQRPLGSGGGGGGGTAPSPGEAGSVMFGYTYRDPSPSLADRLVEEAERYTDLVLHRGFHYGMAIQTPAQRLSENEALRPQSAYTLEIAIRRDPIGIAAAGAKWPVAAPANRTDPGVLVVVSCRQANAPFFQDRLLAITWPRDADSTAALFRFQTGDALPPEPLCIEIRLYARAGLQLLDLLELRFGDGHWTKRQQEIGRLTAPAAAPAEDAVTFHVVAKPGGYDFEVVFTKGGEAHLDAPLGRLVSDEDLNVLLRRVRSYWTRLVIGKLGMRMQLSDQGYAEELSEIVDMGGAAWRTLFGDRRGAQAGTPEALGEALRRHPLPGFAPVRVTMANDADAFVFPWAILCPPLSRDEVPNAESIWGLRYRIELTRKYCEPYLRPVAAGKVRIATVLDPGFATMVDHAATLDRVMMTGVGAELVAGPGTRKAVLDGLEAQPPADIYYYFCHGFAPGRAAVLPGDLLKELRSEVAALTETADQRLWQALLDRLSEGSDVAAIFTGAARITEDDLRRADFFAEGRPIVFLNMCHSADLLPSLRSGLTRVFIDRNAAAVLGTECPVTSVFADKFAEQVLGSLLRGATIGAALLTARRHFHTTRNPLALLYTLYGHEDARVTEANEANEGKTA